MPFVNLYRPHSVEPVIDSYGPDPYDINFPFPVHPESLENELVTLTPFIPREHAALFWEKISAAKGEILRYIPWDLNTIEDFLHMIELKMRRSPEYLLFAVIDKTHADEQKLGGALAGMIGLLKTVTAQLSTEVGPVIVFPNFQRTHVTSNAIGLLLRYCLEVPNVSPPGLGLRRVQWMAHPDNAASVRCAEGMGFCIEGTLRWARVLPTSNGLPAREGDPIPEKAGRHNVLLSVCWDDWENGVRESVAKRMLCR
jgi:RimJ/RimL family protein N-acetyltransferase